MRGVKIFIGAWIILGSIAVAIRQWPEIAARATESNYDFSYFLGRMVWGVAFFVLGCWLLKTGIQPDENRRGDDEEFEEPGRRRRPRRTNTPRRKRPQRPPRR